MPTTQLGKYLRQLRGNLSLREVAKRTNGKLSHSAIAQAEKGQNARGELFTPSFDTLHALSDVYQVDFPDLLKRAGYINTVDALMDPGAEEKEALLLNSFSEDDASNDYSTDQKVQVLNEPPTPGKHPIVIGNMPVTDKFSRTMGGIKNMFAIQVNDDRMNRRIPNGFIAVFGKKLKIESGDICLVSIHHEPAVIAQFIKTSTATLFRPDSYNAGLEPYIFENNDNSNYEIIGKYLYSTDYPI